MQVWRDAFKYLASSKFKKPPHVGPMTRSESESETGSGPTRGLPVLSAARHACCGVVARCRMVAA
eukprot:360246-Chlamydomonas_euryale.AAC.1